MKRNELIHKFDILYSEYERKKQLVEFNHCRCFICGKRLLYNEACIGHFISRRFISTRFDETNANVICYQCNMIDSKTRTVLEKYKQRIVDEYGINELQRIYLLSHKDKIQTYELEEQYKYFKNLLKNLQYSL
jgi:hypothetical protein